MSGLRLDEIADGGLAEGWREQDGERESVIVHRDGDTVRAWLNVCPHAGRNLDVAPGHFVKTPEGLLLCAAHGATFELVAGQCVAGPCRGQQLRAVPVQVRAGEVVLLPD